VLAPNAWDSERSTLQRVERLGTGKIVLLLISGSGTIDRPRIDIQVSADSADLTQKEQAEITAAVGRMFRLDEDLTEFYALCRQRGGAWTRITNGLGRLLRSPSIFEDVVKTICTTNIQWGGTVRMVQGLVNAHGACYPGDTDKRAFPLAARVASGEVDLEAWQDAAIPTPDLKKHLLDIKGVGNYAAATLLMLLGRYDELAVDTAFRRFVSRKYFDGQPPPSDGEAQAVYEDWGRWKYLAYWFDIWQGLDE
jgi:3-methyladenine DNA glycosylase/8-oxoguanine DNA glycosylase